jgi:hypothetical protein
MGRRVACSPVAATVERFGVVPRVSGDYSSTFKIPLRSMQAFTFKTKFKYRVQNLGVAVDLRLRGRQHG